MYELLDTPAAIREVQRFLYVIYDSINPSLPRVAIDGIYGEETVDAVTEFQRIYGLDATGIVDRITFDKLYSLYSSVKTSNITPDYVITGIGFPLRVGCQGKDVINVHLYISELENTYPDIGSVGRGSYYTEQTKNTVINLQNIFKLEPTGEIDAFLYQRILTELDAIRRLEEIYE